MTDNKYTKILLIISAIIMVSCDGGLEPTKQEDKSFIRGMITYVNGPDAWPSPDSVKDIRVVAFKKYPPQDILQEIQDGNALFTEDSLPEFVDTSSFYLEINEPPQTYEYIVVAQNYGGLLEWKAIGVYTLTGDQDKPSPVTIRKGESVNDVNINVDFNNPPPQPF